MSSVREVIVSNAHLDPGPDGKKIFDAVYLVAVFGFLVFTNGFPIFKFLVHGNPHVSLCQDDAEQKVVSSLMLIGSVFWSLLFTFTIIIDLRTRKNLGGLQDIHLENLPTNNVLTFLDTEILCFLLLFQFFFCSILYYLFVWDWISQESSLYLVNITQFVVTNLATNFVFPFYIILKTRRYLPKLWDDNSPLILKNNDFYAERMSQVSTTPSA